MDFLDDEGTPEENQAALIAAIKAKMMGAQRQPEQADFYRGWGNMNLRSGDRVLSALGQSQIGQAQHIDSQGAGLLAALARRRQLAQKTPEELEGISARAVKDRAVAASYGQTRPPKDTSTKDSGDLRKELNSNPVTKSAQDAALAWAKIQSSAKDPSAAGDLALIFNFMKTLDPGSTVREGEFANAQNAGGVDSKIAAQYNNVISGQRLTPEQRTDFLRRGKEAYGAHVARQKQLAGQYTAIAKRKGLNPADVALDMGFEGGDIDLAAPPAAAAPPPGMKWQTNKKTGEKRLIPAGG